MVNPNHMDAFKRQGGDDGLGAGFHDGKIRAEILLVVIF